MASQQNNSRRGAKAKQETKDRSAARAAARAEAPAGDDAPAEPKSVEWRGLVLELPQKLPNTLLFDITTWESGGDALPAYRLLQSIVGPERFTDIRNEIRPDDHVNDTVAELLGEILDQYGLTLGKS